MNIRIISIYSREAVNYDSFAVFVFFVLYLVWNKKRSKHRSVAVFN